MPSPELAAVQEIMRQIDRLSLEQQSYIYWLLDDRLQEITEARPRRTMRDDRPHVVPEVGRA